MVKRERVTDAQGRLWVQGDLDADTYFTQARERAREMARQSIARRMSGSTPAPRVRPAAR